MLHFSSPVAVACNLHALRMRIEPSSIPCARFQISHSENTGRMLRNHKFYVSGVLVSQPLSLKSPSTMAMAHSSDDLRQIRIQSRAISHHLVDFMLREDGIHLKCNYSKLMRSLLASDTGFKDAILTLETCCKDLKLKHQQEIESQVKMLDISHQLLMLNIKTLVPDS